MPRFILRFTCLLLIIPFLPRVGSDAAATREIPQSEKLLVLADELMPAIVRLRGLEAKAPIQKGIKTREEVSQIIGKEVGDRDVKAVLERESVLLKKLGLIPPEMNYVEFRLKLLTEQVGGFYDPEKKALYIAGWLSTDEQKPALVHELTHALQDQHFDLHRMMKKDRATQNDDLSLAHQALAEGDATAVMLDFLLEPMGMSIMRLPDLMPVLRMQLSMAAGQFAVLQSAPEFIRESLMFPYIYGVSFIQKARAKNESWAEINGMYADLPASSEQILHPDKYLAQRDHPRSVKVENPAPRLGKGWKMTYKNVMGEFSMYLLLKLHLPEDVARKAAAGWGGDQVILVQSEAEKRSAVFLEALWDEQDSADRLYGALSAWLHKKHPESRPVSESDSGIALTSDGEYHSLRKRGSTLRLILGLPENLSGKIDNR